MFYLQDFKHIPPFSLLLAGVTPVPVRVVLLVLSQSHIVGYRYDLHVNKETGAIFKEKALYFFSKTLT